MKKHDQLIWWLSQLNRLRSNMKTYLAWKYPDLINEHDDLCNEAIENLTKYIKDNENTLPKSWFINSESIDREDRVHLDRLCITLIKRRTVDYFRKEKKWISHYDIENEEKLVDKTSQERKLLLANVLSDTAKCIREFSMEDQELLSTTYTRSNNHLSDRDRQRLKRLRDKIKDELYAIYGESITDLLKEDLR